MVSQRAISHLAPFAGGDRAALTALVARRALRRAVRVRPRQVARAERRLVQARYRGSYKRYRRALSRRGLTRADAVAILIDDLRIRRLGHRAAERRLNASIDVSLCLRDELPMPELVGLARRL